MLMSCICIMSLLSTRANWHVHTSLHILHVYVFRFLKGVAVLICFNMHPRITTWQRLDVLLESAFGWEASNISCPASFLLQYLSVVYVNVWWCLSFTVQDSIWYIIWHWKYVIYKTFHSRGSIFYNCVLETGAPWSSGHYTAHLLFSLLQSIHGLHVLSYTCFSRIMWFNYLEKVKFEIFCQIRFEYFMSESHFRGDARRKILTFDICDILRGRWPGSWWRKARSSLHNNFGLVSGTI